jgi:elongator complex protein 3
MRAIRNKYDPYEQVRTRLEALEINGHRPEKIELIVIGGTWSVLPTAYKFWFITQCFKAANEFASRNAKRITRNGEKLRRSPAAETATGHLEREQKKNEKAKYKIIGITLETRPDYINEKELIEMRELGATRVELGVQVVDDRILAKNNRGHGVKEIAEATALLRAFGFKITYHLMPGLPGATAKKDLELFKKLFTDERFQPDQIKFYPTVVTRGSKIYQWWKAGKYKPYSEKVLRQLILDCKKSVPEYVRIIRLIRDIPEESIIAGNIITNLRQVMQQEGVACRCIRCREARDKKILAKNLKLNIQKYPAAGGTEYFISFDSRDGETLFGFCRLRLPSLVIARSSASERRSNPVESSKGEIASRGARNDNFIFLNNSALVRELHVYGELIPTGGNKKTQHGGLGTRLLAEAEKIARKNKFKQIAVISGVGVRDYYKKFGYMLKNSYVWKKLA